MSSGVNWSVIDTLEWKQIFLIYTVLTPSIGYLFPAYQGRVWLPENAKDLDGQFLTPAAGITVFFIIIIFLVSYFFFNLNAWLL